MAKTSYHVIAKSDGSWSVKKTGAKRASGIFPTKREAVSTAKRMVTTSGGGELIIHEENGRVKSRDTYYAVPSSSKDNGNICAGNSSRAGEEGTKN